MLSLHDEAVGTVVEANEWGYVIQLSDEQTGFMDKTKSPTWRDIEATLDIGDQVVVVVLDDERTPCRLSAIPDDIEIARNLRAEVDR